MRSPGPATRSARDAANAAAAAVLAFVALWLASTQVRAIREWSPFADDPWDAFMTYAAIFLPFVAVPTWVRSLAHREPVLRASTARRIRWGSGLAAAIVFVAAAADLHAVVTVGFETGAGAIPPLLTGAVLASLIVASAALALTIRAARSPDGDGATGTFEPDVIDDAVVLAGWASARVGLGRPVRRFGNALEHFLDTSPLSPRRHRLAFGLVLAVAAAAAFDAWHAIREGPWANATAPLAFGLLLGSGVLAIYLGTVGPLRILRRPEG